MTVTMARSGKELLFSAIPLLFRIQQLAEGVVWLSFDYSAATLNFVMTQVFSFFCMCSGRCMCRPLYF